MKKYEIPVIKVTEFKQDEEIMGMTPVSGIAAPLDLTEATGIKITLNQ